MKRITLLSVLLMFIVSSVQTQTLSFYSSIGLSEIPLSGWADKMKNIPGYIYSRESTDVSYSFGANYFVSNTQHITFEIEIFNTTTWLMRDCKEDWCALAAQDFIIPSEWNIKSIPLSLGYGYRYSGFGRFFSPSLTLGLSYNLTRINESLGNFDLRREKENEIGVYGDFTVITEISKIFHFRSQIRYKYVSDIKYVTSTDIDVNANLSGLVYSMGFGINL